MKKIWYYLVPIVALLAIFGHPVFADQTSPLQADITSNDQNQLIVHLENTGSQDLADISYQVDLPDDLKLEGDLPKVDLLKSGESKDILLAVKQKEMTPQAKAIALVKSVLPATGEEWTIYTIAGLILLLLAYLLWRYSHARKLLIILAVLSGGIVGTSKVLADNASKTVEVKKVLTLYKKEVAVGLQVQYRELGPVATVAPVEATSSETNDSTEPSSDQVIPQESAVPIASSQSQPSQTEAIASSESTPQESSSSEPSSSSSSEEVAPSSEESPVTSSSSVSPASSESPSSTSTSSQEPSAPSPSSTTEPASSSTEATTAPQPISSEKKEPEETKTEPSASGGNKQEILVSGYAYSSSGVALEEGKISLNYGEQVVEETTTEVDGYFYIHAVQGQTYTLHGQDFEVSITANGNNDIQVEEKLGKFSLGKQILDGDNKTTLLPSVVQFDDIVDYQVDASAGKVVLTTEEKLRAGDIFVLPPNGTYPTGFAYKVVSSKVENGQTILQVTSASLEEVASEIKYDGTLGIDQATFVPADGITVSETPLGEDDLDRDVSVSVSRSYHFGDEKKGFSGDITLTGSLSAKVDIQAYRFYAKGEITPAFNVLVKTNFKAEKALYGELKIGTIVFTTSSGVTIPTDVYIYYDANGEIQVKTKTNFNISVTLGFENLETYSSKDISLKNNLDLHMKGNVKVGPKVVFTPSFLNFSFSDFDAKVGLGLDGEFEAKFSQKNTEAPKLDKAKGKLDLYGDVSLGYNIHIFSIQKEGKFIDNQRLFTLPLVAFDTDKKEETDKEKKEGESTSTDKKDSPSAPKGIAASNAEVLKNYPVYKEELKYRYRYTISESEMLRKTGHPIMYTFYDIDGNGYPELLFMVDGYVTSMYTVGTSGYHNTAHYGKAKVFSLLSSPAGWNIGNTNAIDREAKLRIYKNGKISTFHNEYVSYTATKENQIYRIYSIDSEHPQAIQEKYFESNVANDFQDFEESSSRERLTKEEIDKRYINSEEIDYSSLAWERFDDYPVFEKKITDFSDLDLDEWTGFKHALKYNSKYEEIYFKDKTRYGFYDIDGNGFPELIKYEGGTFRAVALTGNGTGGHDRSGAYGKSATEEEYRLSVDKVYNAQYESSGQLASFDVDDNSIRIFKDGTIRKYYIERDLNHEIYKIHVEFYKINPLSPSINEVTEYISDANDSLAKFSNPGNTEKLSLEEIDKRHIRAEELTYDDLSWHTYDEAS